MPIAVIHLAARSTLNVVRGVESRSARDVRIHTAATGRATTLWQRKTTTEKSKMAKQQIVICKCCGGAFSVFLHEMAEHNNKVVCPTCGAVQDFNEADLVKGASQGQDC